MKLDIFGSGCVNDEQDGSITIVVSDCTDPDNVTFEFTRGPDGAPDPVVTALGNGEYQVTSSVPGAFEVMGTCNG